MLVVQVTYKEGGDWNTLYLSGSAATELQRTKIWDNKKVFAIKYPDGKVYDVVLNRYRTKEGH